MYVIGYIFSDYGNFVFRRPLFKPLHAKRLSATTSSNPVVTPDIESAASSLLEMSNNAAARAQHLSGTVSKPPFDHSASKTQFNTTDTRPHSNSSSASTLRESISVSSTTVSDSNSTVTRTSSLNSPPADRAETYSSGTVLSKSNTDKTGLSVNTGNRDQNIQISSQPTINTPAISPVLKYNQPANEHMYQTHTVQNFCHPVYQGVGLCQSPLPTPFQGQQFSFVQPLLQHTGPNISYQLPQFPCVPYQTGYSASMTSQLTAWPYISNVENQYPINLSTHVQPQSATISNEGGAQNLSRNYQNSSLNTEADGSQLGQPQPQKGIKRTAFTIQTELNSKTNAAVCDTNNESKSKKSRNESGSLPLTGESKNGSRALSASKIKNEPSKSISTSDTTLPMPQISKSNLQALSDLTLGIGIDSVRKDSTRIFLGTGMQISKPEKQVLDLKIPKSDSSKTLPSEDGNKMFHLKSSENKRPGNISMSSESDRFIPRTDMQQNEAKSGESVYIDPNRKRLSLTAFPYSQEIKLPDGQMSLIKLKGDCISLANIKRMHAASGDGKEKQDENLDPNIVELLTKGKAKTVQELMQLQNAHSLQQVRLGQVKENEYLTKDKQIQNAERIFGEISTSNGNLKTDILQVLKQEDLNLKHNVTNNLTDRSPGEKKEQENVHSKSDTYSYIKENHNTNITIKLGRNSVSSVENLNAGKPQHLAEIIKPRSKSDSSLSSVELSEPYKYPAGKQRKNRKGDINSEGDSGKDNSKVGDLKHSENLEDNTNRTKDMVHVVDKDQVVTVKVAKYPELTIVPSRSTGKSKLGLQMSNSNYGDSSKKRINNSQQGYLQNVVVGKVPVLRSVAKEPSCLSLAERQYLDQIQQFPQIKYQNSSLAQLLMNDIKCVDTARTGTDPARQIMSERKSGPGVVRILPEQLISEKSNLKLPPKPITSDSSLSQQSGNHDSLASLVNDKSTNTNQEDDEVFLEDMPFNLCKSQVPSDSINSEFHNGASESSQPDYVENLIDDATQPNSGSNSPQLCNSSVVNVEGSDFVTAKPTDMSGVAKVFSPGKSAHARKVFLSPSE